MEKFIVKGGIPLKGKTKVSGAKNVALKAIVAACLTDEEVTIENIPLISDFSVMADIVEDLGGKIEITDHVLKIKVEKFKKDKISLEKAAEIRTSSMLMIPLLARFGKAIIPNPGGCRIGKRPIDRTIDGLKKMNILINYNRGDGYFYARVNGKIKGANYKFEKNTHTGTETLILASVLAKGTTILENAASEPEVDELISFLNKMGAKIKRVKPRTIKIEGVEKLHGAIITIGPDRNEIVTLAIAAVVTGGDIFIENVKKEGIIEFLEKFKEVGGGVEFLENGIRFYAKDKELIPTNITTQPFPGFMTDWQGPWAVLMTKAKGMSIIHEAIYENRFGYASELEKMGANIELFNPVVKNPKTFYNFNLSDDNDGYKHAAKISGPVELHNGIVAITDLRAGATLVLAALAAKGKSVIIDIEHLDRGYEGFDQRLKGLGANIKRVKE